MSILFDEFGNLVGDGGDDGYSDSDGSRSPSPAPPSTRDGAAAAAGATHDANGASSNSTAIVLHEDKALYATAGQIYGADVEVVVADEEEAKLTAREPLVEVVRAERIDGLGRNEIPPDGAALAEFAAGLRAAPALTRNVAVVGRLQHGKSSMLDVLVKQTHPSLRWPGMNDASRHGSLGTEAGRYTHTRRDEQLRLMSIKMTPLSLVLPALRGKHYGIQLFDTPGHPNFGDEVTTALRLSDGVLLVIDCVEGVSPLTADTLRLVAQHGLPLVVMLNKVDRLILELKLPPTDAYHKMRHILDEVNSMLRSFNVVAGGRPKGGGGEGGAEKAANVVSPELGNVVFASALHNWSFSLEQFAQRYAERFDCDAAILASKLWGNVYYVPQSGRFVRKSSGGGDAMRKRSFIEFVLEPLYKLYSQTLTEDRQSLTATLRDVDIELSATEMQQDVQPLLRCVLSRFFGAATGLAQMLIDCVPSPQQQAAEHARRSYGRGDEDSAAALDDVLVKSIERCDADGPLLVHVTKQFESGGKVNAAASVGVSKIGGLGGVGASEGMRFDGYGRVFSGTLRVGAAVRVLGEAFSLRDEEDAFEAVIGQLWVLVGRYRVPVQSAPAGSCVLIEGVDHNIAKTMTIVERTEDAAARGVLYSHGMRALQYPVEAVVKVSVEPWNPAELPKLVDALRRVSKAYPLLRTRVEESGEHVLVGSGELYLDCVLHDVRRVYGDVEIRVSQPLVTLRETVVASSAIGCFASTPNRKNRITVIAEPLGDALAQDIEQGLLSAAVAVASQNAPTLATSSALAHARGILQRKYSWDELAAESVWTFGPHTSTGPNVLLNDTLPVIGGGGGGDDQAKLLELAREALQLGFKWATAEGPLCEEPMRGVKVRLMDATIAADAVARSSGQIAPTMRRVVYSAALLAEPRLMEPVYAIEVLTPVNAIEAVHALLARRRGHIMSDAAVAGTPLRLLRGLIPVLDAFGFEVDLRTMTHGRATVLSTFDHYAVVPGDPLDASIVLQPLEPSPIQHLSRELLLKVRRRKGLSEDVRVAKFMDTELQAHLEQQSLMRR